MTPQELNKAIAELVYPQAEWVEEEGAGVLVYWNDGKSTFVDADYCNNWSDLMPLVVEHEISFDVSQCGTSWCATGNNFDDVITESDNPQLALAECLLQVLRAKAKEQDDG